MKISIVTIVFNEVGNIDKTLESVYRQTYAEIEHIVADGGSTDGTYAKVQAFAEKWRNRSGVFSCASERDGGIYFGMNNGLARCTGDYVIFCNAGDVFADDEVVAKLVSAAESAAELPDLIYGDVASEIDGKVLSRTAHGEKFMPYGMPACHESMMYNIAIIRKLKLRYDTTYRISADYKFTYQFVNASTRFCYVKIVVVVYEEGGVSKVNKWKGLAEACRARKEVGGLSLLRRFFIRMAQTAALLLSTYAGPLYRLIRLRKI